MCCWPLLSGSVLTGITAFLFSTGVITVFGEIFPHAYFSRHALKFGFLLSPVLRFHQVVLNFLDLGDVPVAAEGEPVNPLSIISLPSPCYCHKGSGDHRCDVISRPRVMPEHLQDDVVDHDVILLWNENRGRSS
ncbi:MAG: hypothetical protein A4E70_02337 [Syntrophus sp. PtaU1.Bin005]|nr:MAG: hypothetical protein A4E70_02337 [Syntrophus sp. PtaU1.Bin005]